MVLLRVLKSNSASASDSGLLPYILNASPKGLKMVLEFYVFVTSLINLPAYLLPQFEYWYYVMSRREADQIRSSLKNLVSAYAAIDILQWYFNVVKPFSYLEYV